MCCKTDSNLHQCGFRGSTTLGAPFDAEIVSYFLAYLIFVQQIVNWEFFVSYSCLIIKWDSLSLPLHSKLVAMKSTVHLRNSKCLLLLNIMDKKTPITHKVNHGHDKIRPLLILLICFCFILLISVNGNCIKIPHATIYIYTVIINSQINKTTEF